MNESDLIATLFQDQETIRALIIATQAVTVAGIGVLGVYLQRVHRTAKESKEQVTNNHTTNMREEQDERHDEIMQELRGQRQDIRQLNGRMDDVSGRVRTIERRGFKRWMRK